MEIRTKFNLQDKVVFDEKRIGVIVGFEINSTMKEPGYTKPCYPQYKDNTEVRYQIKPVDGGEDLYGSMREESTLKQFEQ